MILVKKISTKIIVGLASIACIAGFFGYNRYTEHKQKITSDKNLSAAEQNNWSKKNLSLILDEQPSEKTKFSSINKLKEEQGPDKETIHLPSLSNTIPTTGENVTLANNENTKNDMPITTTHLPTAAEITQTVVSKEITPVVAPENKKNTKTRAS